MWPVELPGEAGDGGLPGFPTLALRHGARVHVLGDSGKILEILR